MTKSTITDERITSVIERLEHFASNLKWTDVRGAQDLLTAADGLRELQERRKPLLDKDLQGVLGALEHPAGINAAGKQVVRSALVELQERRKAAMDSEPVAYAWVSRSGKKHLTRCEPEQWRDAVIVTPLYRHAQPAPELAAIVERLNLSGYEYEGGEVTPQNAAAIVDTLLQQLDDAVQGRNAQPAPVVPAVSDDIGEIRVGRLPTMNQDDYPGLGDWWVQLRIGEDSDEVLARVYGATPQEANSRAEALACRAAMLQAEPVTTANKLGNSPVIPDGYVMVPMRLTAENGAKGALSGEFSETKFVNCPECFGDDECETCDGSGRIEIKVPVSWTTIKEIWIKSVEHFAAAPQENN
ncbi:hypothetical protein [Klebsiella aerogenes]|uniref:hypothetical protein n=1 Tax=Klebsiella aerogenes TaxID=548 RepID=UPI0038793461